LRILSYITLFSIVFSDPPAWEDTPGSYQFTASMTAAVITEDGSVQGYHGDMLGAFDSNGNVRGLSSMLDGLEDYAGIILHSITLRSNASGDIINFQYYDASLDEIYDLNESYVFIINDLVGNLMDPHILSYDNMANNDLLLPFNCALEQNYPNPYNPITHINYSIANLSNVVLRIYDIKGQLITELLSEIHMPGKYNKIWDSRYFSTGIYFLDMKVYSIHNQLIYTAINKMLYLK